MFVGDVGQGLREEIDRQLAINPNGTEFQDATALLDPTGLLRFGNLSSFGEDAAGELYIVDYSQGAVFLIVPEPGVASLFVWAALGCLAACGLVVRHPAVPVAATGAEAGIPGES